MKQETLGRRVKLLPSLAKSKQNFDREYLLSLKDENLLFSFYTEAGLSGWHVDKPEKIHWGWDGPLSHIRGTFTGHWLSACARLYDSYTLRLNLPQGEASFPLRVRLPAAVRDRL